MKTIGAINVAMSRSKASNTPTFVERSSLTQNSSK